MTVCNVFPDCLSSLATVNRHKISDPDMDGKNCLRIESTLSTGIARDSSIYISAGPKHGAVICL